MVEGGFEFLKFLMYGTVLMLLYAIVELARQFFGIFLLNFYGFIEGGVVVCSLSSYEVLVCSNSVGCFLLSIEVRIVDGEGAGLSVDEVGEICFKVLVWNCWYY